MIEPFPDRYRRALNDPALRRTLLEFQRTWRLSRDRGVQEIDFEALRNRLKQVKDEVITHLPQYLRAFEAEASARGAIVHSASSASDAVDYVVDLARSRGATRAIKSKSMVSEEIGLNEGLELAGIHAVETDLGEWIVQLAGERPSHIVGPALHKNRRQVADLFESATGEPVDHENISAQVDVARRFLRSEFLAGELGISGANALIAETGSVVIVTNEGNAELVTTLPKYHVVIAGIEKIVPTIDDAMTLLQLLAPTATGQAATSYVSVITGPADEGYELHIVLVDNGRNAMREDPLFRDTLRCIRCGACSSVCPAYGVVGGHVFGHIYSGAIGLVNTPFHHGLEADAGPQSLCVSCNACQSVCPVDIPLPRQILDTRAEVTETLHVDKLGALAMSVWSRPRLFRGFARTAARLQRPIQRGGFIQLPGLRKLTEWRRLPALARRPFRDGWDENLVPTPEGGLADTLRGVTVAYFVQCLTDWLYPEMGTAIVDVLRALGARVVFPRAQHCCGLPAVDSGHLAAARRMALQTIATLEACDAEWIVSGGTSCVIAMLHDYPHLLRDDQGWLLRAERLAGRVKDFTTFLLDVAKLPAGALTSTSVDATYHFFCQSYNVLGFRREPERLLGEVCGIALKPLPEESVCCGFGGSVSFKRPEVARHILERKLENVDATGCEVLVTDNPGCIMHLRGGVAASRREIRVAHTAEIVADHIRVRNS
jgi:L-lactate dehydrogenase complex protein LldF